MECPIKPFPPQVVFQSWCFFTVAESLTKVIVFNSLHYRTRTQIRDAPVSDIGGIWKDRCFYLISTSSFYTNYFLWAVKWGENSNLGLQKAEERRNCIIKILTRHPIQKSLLKQQFGILKNLFSTRICLEQGFSMLAPLPGWTYGSLLKSKKEEKKLRKRKKCPSGKRDCHCDKALGPEATRGREGSLQLTLTSHTVHHGGMSRQDLKQKPWRMEDTAYWITLSSCSATFLMQPKPNYSRRMLPIVGWALKYQSIIKTISHGHGCCPPWYRNFFDWSSLFPVFLRL